jgi:hypothetical protein
MRIGVELGSTRVVCDRRFRVWGQREAVGLLHIDLYLMRSARNVEADPRRLRFFTTWRAQSTVSESLPDVALCDDEIE